MVHTRDEGEVPPVWRNQTRQTVEGLLERDMIPTSHKERVVAVNLGRESVDAETAFELELGPNNCAVGG